MEAGYDYLLLRPQFQQRFIQGSAIFLFITGAILLTAGIAYFVYAENARSNLNNLNFAVTAPPAATTNTVTAPELSLTAPRVGTTSGLPATLPDLGITSSPIVAIPNVGVQSPPVQLPPVQSPPVEVAQTAPVVSPPVLPVPQEVVKQVAAVPPAVSESPVLPAKVEEVPVVVETVSQSPQPIEVGSPPPAKEAVIQLSPSAIASQQLYPGTEIRATYWSNPLEYEPASYVESSLIQGFRPIDSRLFASPGTLSAPTRIIIPQPIEVDSDVAGLQVMDLGDSRAYETPKHVVGHIPESANPGERGSLWLFGHLESPLAGEGNVFYNLPKIPDLLRKGEDVYTIVESGSVSYLYKITESFVVHQDDLKLDYEHLRGLKPDYAHLDPNGANIHLVACVPRFVYDSRLVVSGVLVGIHS
jgi:hypothetical protein